MKRAEAVALLKELSASHLIQPSCMSIEQRKPDRFQLCVKGDYDCELIELFLLDRELEFEENPVKGLCIFKP